MAQNGLLKTELGFQGYIMSDWVGPSSEAQEGTLADVYNRVPLT
jgi:beta-glucosidase-like glycosyl hydrolase